MQSKGISLLFFVILPKSNNVMTRLRHYIMAFIATFLFTTFASGQSINPTASYIDENGDSATLNSGDSYSGSAPLAVHFAANASETDGYTAYYEWRIYSEQDETSPLYTRYEENTDFTFNQAGSFRVYLIARFTSANGDEVAYGQEDFQPITISISESELNMPNAFSPNGDGINDIYKPKSGYKSIVKFDAYILTAGESSCLSGTTRQPAGTEPTKESLSRMAFTSAWSKPRVPMGGNSTLRRMSTSSEDISKEQQLQNKIISNTISIGKQND